MAPPGMANETTPLVYSAPATNDKDTEAHVKPTYMSQFSRSVREHIGKIGMLGSMSIAVNSLTGPAMLNLPSTYQQSGVIPTTLTLVFVCILSALCCLHMANTISKVPRNADFKREVRMGSCILVKFESSNLRSHRTNAFHLLD